MAKRSVTPANGDNDIVGVAQRNNVDVVVLATYLCGGRLRCIDTEDVAVRTADVVPGRFSWRKYPKQINIEQVRRRLSEAKSDGLLSGSQTQGWMMTAAGSKYVEDHLLKLTRGIKGRTSIAMADRQWKAAERKRLLRTSAYKKFKTQNADEITTIDVGEFFRIDAYMADDARRTKLDRFINVFRRDSILGPVVEFLTTKIQHDKG